VNTRTWIDWPDAPGFWWASFHGVREPVLVRVDDDLDVIDLDTRGWWFHCDRAHLRQSHNLRFLPTGLVRPEAP